MDRETEGKSLVALAMGKLYDAELRKAITDMGMKRFGTTQWISKETNSKYEMFTVSRPEGNIISRIDVIDGTHRIHLREEKPVSDKARKSTRTKKIDIHGNTRNALLRQLEATKEMMITVNKWDREMKTDSELGQQLRALTGNTNLTWDDFMFLPDPLCSGRYLFANIGTGKVSQIHAWLSLSGGNYIIPAENTTQGAFASLATGIEFHQWERQNLRTTKQAIDYTLQLLNSSDTSYVFALRKMLNCELRNFTIQDLYCNADGDFCRVETTNTSKGVMIDEEIPIAPTIADVIDSLIAPVIVSQAAKE